MAESEERGSGRLAGIVSLVDDTNATLKIISMKIFNVLGLALLIITLKFLTPEVYSGIKNTLLVFFDTAQGIMKGAKYPMTAGFFPNIPTISQ